MADSVHNALSKFRDTMLTAVALLEFELRDSMTKNGSDLLVSISTSVLNIEKKLSTNESAELMEIKPSVGSGNIVVSRTQSPNLSGRSFLDPPMIDLNESSDVEVEEEEILEDVSEEEEDEDEDGIEVEEFEYKGTVYQRDSDNNVYLDGELVGLWTGKIIKAI